MTTPSITPAQILSVLTSFVGLLVTQGAVTNGTGKLVGGLAAIVVPAAWQVADAIIRHGRAKVAAAQVGAATAQASAEAWTAVNAAKAAPKAVPVPAAKPRSRAKKASGGPAR